MTVFSTKIRNKATYLYFIYLGRQAFSLQENNTASQMKDLKQQVSSYFGIPSGTNAILQGDTFQDHNKNQ